MTVPRIASADVGSAAPSRLPRTARSAVILLFLAIAVRLVFFVGYQGRDDRNYLSYALYLASGQDLGKLDVQTQWVGRIGFWIPVAASIKVLGANQAGYVAYPLVCSIAGVLLTLAFGTATVGVRPALLAASLLTIFPLDVLYATKAYPDLPLGVFMTASYWLALRSRVSPASRWLPLVAGLTLGAAYLQKETALFALVPIGIALRFWGRDNRRALAIFSAAVVLVIAGELAFWSTVKDDPLYRFHAADTALERALDQGQGKAQSGGWLPGPKPSEIYRSSNSLLDAALMLGMNEEFGLLYWLLVPLLVISSMRRDEATRDLRIWILILLPMILFLPVHWPRYTMPRDPRYLTCLTIPGLLVLASFVLRATTTARALVLAAVIATSLFGAFLGKESSRMEPQKTLASRATTHERLWLTPQLAADLLIMSGADPNLPIGMHFLEQGRNAASFQAARLIRPGLPLAETPQDIKEGILVLRGRAKVAAPAGWTLAERIEPRPSWGISQVQRVLRSLGLPGFARKLAPGGGETALLYRAAENSGRP